jgi:lambda repressor-like predicted transcriptional regulator
MMVKKRNIKKPRYKTNANLIKSLLVLRGIKLVDLAREFGITKQYLWYVIHGRRKGERIRKKIAQFLGMQYEQLWRE